MKTTKNSVASSRFASSFHCSDFFSNIVSVLQAAVPFAVVGANQVIEIRGKKVRGRMYPWGVVEVENPEHSDFIKLRTMLM